MADANRLFAQGRATSAKARLEQALNGPDSAEPAARLDLLRALVDTCLRSFDDPCLARYAPLAAQAAREAPVANDLMRAELARETAYDEDLARYALGAGLSEILKGPAWANENAYNGDLYLRRQVLAVRIRRDLWQDAALDGVLDRILSLLASVDRPQASPDTLARTVADVLAILVETGRVERAWGLYRASGPALLRLLPAASVDGIGYRLTEAGLLERVGDLKGAAIALDAAVTGLRAVELGEPVRRRLLADALGRRAAVAAARATWTRRRPPWPSIPMRPCMP